MYCVLGRRLGRQEGVRTFGTMTRDLLALSDWLAQQRVSHVAMESTGVFWKPIFNILESRFEVVLVNARHIKQVPGRKTDVKDCEWIADLLRHGLLRASFVPDRPQRDLRDLTRHRAQLVGETGRVANRIQKVLEDANIKLSSVATDVLGVSGRAMIQALLRGERHPRADGRIGPREAAQEEVLPGGRPRRARHGTPSLHAADAMGPHELPGADHRGNGPAHRRADAPF